MADPRAWAGVGTAYCGHNATCANTVSGSKTGGEYRVKSQAGSFTCPCHPGYENHKGNVGCSDVNECVISTGVGTCSRRTNISVPSDKLLRGEHQLQQLAGILRV